MKTKSHKRQPHCRFIALGLFSSVPLYLFLGSTTAKAQVGILDDIDNELAAAKLSQQAKLQDYTYKSGDFSMLLIPALSLQWNSNINLTDTDQQSDFILFPTLGILMNYPLTDLNTLQLNVTVGYSDYLQHSDLSTWFLSTGSGISFDFAIGDILFNLHDQFNYVQNPAQNSQVAGTGSFGTFNNSAGFSADWSLKYFDTTVGFDHQNTLATQSEFNQLDSSTETGYLREGYKVNSKLTTGVEGTIAYTAYDQDVLNNNTSYSAGVYGDWRPDAYLHISPRFGYVINQFQQTSSQLQSSNVDSWYLDLSVTHQLTKSFSYSLDVGHNLTPGVQSQVTEYWYANGGITWSFIKNFSLQPNFFYQHGNQGIGTTIINPANPNLVNEIYDWYGGGISFNYAITKRFAASLNYTITQRTSSAPGRGYTQNVIGIQLSYHSI
jgi:hypothetical protein